MILINAPRISAVNHSEELVHEFNKLIKIYDQHRSVNAEFNFISQFFKNLILIILRIRITFRMTFKLNNYFNKSGLNIMQIIIDI